MALPKLKKLLNSLKEKPNKVNLFLSLARVGLISKPEPVMLDDDEVPFILPLGLIDIIIFMLLWN